MDESLIIAFATLGGSFIGIIFGALFNQWLKVRRKRLDYLFNELDKLNDYLTNKHVELSKLGMKNREDAQKMRPFERAQFNHRQDAYAHSIILFIVNQLVLLSYKPEIMKMKIINGKETHTIRKSSIFGKEKRKRIELRFLNLTRADYKFDIKNPGEGVFITEDYCMKKVICLAELYREFKTN